MPTMKALPRPEDVALLKELRKRVDKARNFPTNTDPFCRHVQMMAEGLLKKGGYPMLQEEPEHCAISLLATVASLYETRTELAKALETQTVTQKRAVRNTVRNA